MNKHKPQTFYFNQGHIDILTQRVPGPSRINIELTSFCNINCIMCRGKQQNVRVHKRECHLTVNEFIKILEGTDRCRLTSVVLAGDAEPLLNPDILSILSVLIKEKIFIEIISNGMLLGPEVSKKLIGNSREVHISFAGSNKSTFEFVRQGADFSQVCENIRFLSDLKRKYNNPLPYIWINPILMKKTIKELPETILLAKDTGCQGVACSHLDVESPELIEESLFFHQEETNYYLKKATEVANQNNIALTLPPSFGINSDQKTTRQESWKTCSWFWNHVVFYIDGVIPCSGGVEIDFDGNVIENRFVDIWNNDWYANMRRRLITMDPPEECINCKNPSVKDINHIGCHFSDDMISKAVDYSQSLPILSILKEVDGEGLE